MGGSSFQWHRAVDFNRAVYRSALEFRSPIINAMDQSPGEVQVGARNIPLPRGADFVAAGARSPAQSAATKALDRFDSIGRINRILLVASVGLHSRCHLVLAMVLPRSRRISIK